MSDQSTPPLPAADREALLLRYWRRGDLTPLRLANALARGTAPSAEAIVSHNASR